MIEAEAISEMHKTGKRPPAPSAASGKEAKCWTAILRK